MEEKKKALSLGLQQEAQIQESIWIVFCETTKWGEVYKGKNSCQELGLEKTTTTKRKKDKRQKKKKEELGLELASKGAC